MGVRTGRNCAAALWRALRLGFHLTVCLQSHVSACLRFFSSVVSCSKVSSTHALASAARLVTVVAMDMFASTRSQAALGAGRQPCVQHIVNSVKPAVQARTRVRCVKPEALYSPKHPEHRRELEPRSALALQIAEASGARPSHIGLSTPAVPQPSTPRRLRVAVDVDEG